MLYWFIFWNHLGPRRLGCALTLRYARLYPWQSRASLGGYNGETPERPQKVANVFRNISVSTLSFSYPWKKTDARRKQLRYGAGRVEGPPTPPGYGTPLTTLRLRCL